MTSRWPALSSSPAAPVPAWLLNTTKILGGMTVPLMLLMLGAWFTDYVGIYAVFGAFILGIAMPRGIVSRAGNVRNIHITGCDIESNMAKDAPPDGHTLYFGTISALATHVATHARLPYDPLRDFAAERAQLRRDGDPRSLPGLLPRHVRVVGVLQLPEALLPVEPGRRPKRPPPIRCNR